MHNDFENYTPTPEQIVRGLGSRKKVDCGNAIYKDKHHVTRNFMWLAYRKKISPSSLSQSLNG